MKVIVCGAGQVGFHLARYLSADSNDVTVIDNSAAVINHVVDAMDVQGIVGCASYPEVLASAGAKEAEMLIAVTQLDEVNMLACQVASSLFDVPTKIARIRDQHYLEPHWAGLYSSDHLPVDFIISPELEVAHSIERTLKVPGSFEIFLLANGVAKAVGVRCLESSPIVKTPLRHLKTLFPDLDISIVAIIRDNTLILPSGEDTIVAGDHVFFVTAASQVREVMRGFGYMQEPLQRVVILGSGGIGLRLATSLCQGEREVDVLIIENDRARANLVAREIPQAIVLHGDALDSDILKEAGIDRADTVVAITNDDKVNILSSLLAKNLGARRAISLVNQISYASLMFPLGIDAVISPRGITVSTILQQVRRGRVRMAYSLQETKGEIIDVEVFSTSTLIGRELRDVEISRHVLVAAVVRAGEFLMPKPSFILEVGDRIIMTVAADAVKKVEKLFSSRS